MTGSEQKAETSTTTTSAISDAYVRYLNTLSTCWSSHGAAKMLTTELIDYLVPRFHRCSTPVKVRVLMSLLYIPSDLREQNAEALCGLLSDFETDRDDWVRKLCRLLQPYVATGQVDLKEVDTETAYRIIRFLDESIAGQDFVAKPAMEAPYMCNVLNCTDYSSKTSDRYYMDELNFRPKIDFAEVFRQIERAGYSEMQAAGANMDDYM